VSALHRMEAAFVRAAIWLVRQVPVTTASNLGGAVARAIGPLLPVSKVADDNLRHAYPDMDAAERRRIVRGVWDNLGRTAAELPHIGAFRRTASGPGWELEGEANTAGMVGKPGPAILLSGHIGNWELLPVATASFGVHLSFFYRAAANKEVDRIIQDLRGRAVGADIPVFQKSMAGALAARAFLGQGGFLGMLVDQKMNEGIPVPFFGRPAMTATVAAAFALHFRCPVLVGHVRRIGPARFRVIVGPPLELPDTGHRSNDIVTLTHMITAELERRIRSYPEGWLWLHRRWPKDPD
jgi:KDO2-lipid IV(A) lauroyltransferase